MVQPPQDIVERLERMNAAPFALRCGIEVGEGRAKVRMHPQDCYNALGTYHGGAVFTLADQAFALAANQGPDVQVAMSASIHYIRPARGTIEAVARLVGESGRTSIYEVLVYEGEELVAIFQGTGYKLARKGI